MKKLLANSVTYILIYIVLMIPTYVLPYFGSNSVIANGAGALVDAASGGKTTMFTHFPFLLHAAFLIALCVTAFIRGGIISKKWILVFPLIALICDLTPGLSSIPFLPSILHLLAIILGVVGADKLTVHKS